MLASFSNRSERKGKEQFLRYYSRSEVDSCFLVITDEIENWTEGLTFILSLDRFFEKKACLRDRPVRAKLCRLFFVV